MILFRLYIYIILLSLLPGMIRAESWKGLKPTCALQLKRLMENSEFDPRKLRNGNKTTILYRGLVDFVHEVKMHVDQSDTDVPRELAFKRGIQLAISLQIVLEQTDYNLNLANNLDNIMKVIELVVRRELTEQSLNEWVEYGLPAVLSWLEGLRLRN